MFGFVRVCIGFVALFDTVRVCIDFVVVFDIVRVCIGFVKVFNTLDSSHDCFDVASDRPNS